MEEEGLVVVEDSIDILEECGEATADCINQPSVESLSILNEIRD